MAWALQSYLLGAKKNIRELVRHGVDGPWGKSEDSCDETQYSPWGQMERLGIKDNE